MLTIILLIITMLPVGQVLLAPLETRFLSKKTLPKTVEGIIVLGGAFNASVMKTSRAELGSAADRVTTFIELAKRYPGARLIYSGGVGNLTGARNRPIEMAKTFFELQGLDTRRIIFEGDSRNTWENAVFSKDLAYSKAGDSWILITSASHMPRAVGIFRHLDWRVFPVPVDYQTMELTEMQTYAKIAGEPNVADRLAEFDHAIKEWVGLVAYWLMGRTDNLFPAP